jgi:glutathione S-transferase
VSPRLLTLPVSHFCEKGRWALELAGIPFTERGYIPGLHAMKARTRGSATLPVLTHGRRVIRGSDAIVRFADESAQLGLYSDRPAERREVESLIRQMDEGLGPDARLWLYTWGCEDPDLYVELIERGLGPVARRTVRPLKRGLIALTAHHFGIGERSREESAERLESTLQALEDRRNGSPYLVGERFTAADLTFAALCAPLVAPPEYGVALPQIDELPDTFGATLRAWRDTPSGATALRLYREHRRPGA